MTKLHVIDGQVGDQFFDFEDDVIFLGRASDNDVQIKDYSISRNHLKIIRKGAKYLIEDQRSRNGTWVDGDLLESGKELEVREGAPIVVGNTLISLGDKAPQDNMLTLYGVSVLSPKGKDRENLIYKDRRFTSRRSLELIYEVSTVLMQSLNIEDVCKKIMDCLFSYLKRIDSGAILWIDNKTGELTEIVSRSRDNQESIKISHSRTIVNRVMREGKAVVISDISCEREENLSRSMEKMLIKSVMCVPLIIKSEIRGVFYVHSENVRNGFRRDDLFLLTGLSTPAALAIENGLLHSKREQVEEKLRNAHHELERRVEERTAELIKTNEDLVQEIRERKQAEEKREKMEAQLLQAQKMEAVGTLAGGIAHDFNNLLQAVQGYAELLLMRKKEGEHGWRDLKEIIHAAKRGAELTQQLLTFSRKVESKKRPLDLNQEVEELRKLLERTIPKMIEVKLQLSDDLQAINADAVQLKQVLMNLAVNAKDAMPGGGSLLIETENVILDQEFCRKYAEVKPGDYVQLTISDSGHGMNKETVEHMFDPFYTTKEVGKGTGLGLAIVYGIIKDHEGYIMCHSEPREGTAFKIYLPALLDGMETTEEEPAETTVTGGTETILLVDDEVSLLGMGKDLLTRFGYTVLTSPDGESALELFQQEKERIDLVVLDLIMPGMGGRRCLEELLKIDSHAKVLVASGHSPDERTKEVLNAGAKAFVSKPYKFKQMLKAVREVLDRD